MEDQLRASEGWVRCGHCRQIFDALERLFQLEESATSAGSAPPASSQNPPGPPGSPPHHGGALIEPDVAWAETRPAMFGEEHLLVPSSPEASVSPAVTPAATATEVSLDEALGRTEPSDRVSESIPGPVTRPVEPVEAAIADLTFVATPLPVAAGAEDSSPDTQPQSLSFVDTATGDETAGPIPAATSPASETEEPADSSTMFLIEDVGTDKEVEAAQAKELIQELEPSSVIQQRQAQQGMDSENVPLASESSQAAYPGSSRPTGAGGELSASRGGGRRRSSATSTTRGSAALSADEHQGASIPAFVRRANSKARWQRPWVRACLALAALGCALALSAQTAIQWHDLIGARSPALRPLVQDLCRNTTGCVLDPPRLIDAVVVESSALTRPSELIGYRLNVLIHNRLEHEIAPPHLELTLTDISGAVLVRRVLTPTDFGVTRNALEPQSESAWQLDFHYDTPAISGYTVRAFYP